MSVKINAKDVQRAFFYIKKKVYNVVGTFRMTSLVMASRECCSIREVIKAAFANS